jgi:hypothetical protein
MPCPTLVGFGCSITLPDKGTVPPNTTIRLDVSTGLPRGAPPGIKIPGDTAFAVPPYLTIILSTTLVVDIPGVAFTLPSQPVPNQGYLSNLFDLTAAPTMPLLANFRPLVNGRYWIPSDPHAGMGVTATLPAHHYIFAGLFTYYVN